MKKVGEFLKNKFCFLTLLMVFGLNAVYAQCGPSTAQNPSAINNDASTGSLGWSNMFNSQISDGSFASAGQLLGVLTSVQTNRLKFTDFGFSIPSTATVCGIEVSVRKNAAGLIIGSSITDKDVYIVKNGSLAGSNHAAGSWSGSNNWVTYGNSSDAWGTTWTPADINSANFGITMSAQLNSGLAGLFLTANIDAVTITVYYNNTIPLAVVMPKFEAEAQSSKVKVSWQTNTEDGIDALVLEKMNSAGSWNAIANFKSKGSSSSSDYTVYDENPVTENYYRVKKIETNGDSDYSKIVYLRYEDNAIGVYPVPATDYITVASKEKIIKAEVFNDLFQLVKAAIPENNSLNIQELKAGLYFLKITTEKNQHLKKFQKAN